MQQATFTDKKFKHVSNSCLDFMKRLLVRDARYRMSTGMWGNHSHLAQRFPNALIPHGMNTDRSALTAAGEALRHPFITGAPFYPRYASMQAGDFDQYLPEEEKDGGGAVVVRSVEKTNTILESLKVFAGADPLTKITMELVSHTLGSLQVATMNPCSMVLHALCR